MTFEFHSLDIPQLETDHFNELAKLIREIGIDFIPITGAEAKALVDTDARAKDLTDFELNLRGLFLMGKVEGQIRVITPSLLLSEPLKENTWFDHAPTASILHFIRNRLGDETLLNKIQSTFADTFEYLSTGQAKSVIKRYLGFPLTSSERNDIYRLRKKIEGYKQLINAFEDKLAVNHQRIDPYVDHDPRSSLPTEEDLVQNATGKLAYMCWECKKHVPLPEGDIIEPPTHHDRPMTLNWNVTRPLEEIESGSAELQKAIKNPSGILTSVDSKVSKEPKGIPEGFPKLYCGVCGEYQEIDDELQKRLDAADHRITLPSHHGKEMQVLIYPKKHLEGFMELGEKYNLFTDDREPGLYYVCEECMLLVKADDIDPEEFHSKEAPQHHSKEMGRMRVPDSSEKTT